MQQYQLTIKANQRPETLERILRVIRHRGFEVRSFSAEISQGVVYVQAQVQSERPRELLFNQLIKLPDVIALEA